MDHDPFLSHYRLPFLSGPGSVGAIREDLLRTGPASRSLQNLPELPFSENCPGRWPEGKPTKRTPSKGIVLEDLGRDDSQLLEQDIMQDGMPLRVDFFGRNSD